MPCISVRGLSDEMLTQNLVDGKNPVGNIKRSANARNLIQNQKKSETLNRSGNICGEKTRDNISGLRPFVRAGNEKECKLLVVRNVGGGMDKIKGISMRG